jgi:2-(1,2-epoxy-1,2-dihydrophenyl)acetyl-CoA isomerase
MDWLLTDDRGPVRWLTLNRPEKKNALPHDGWPDLRRAIGEFEASKQRVLVLTGAGGEFCAGADLDSMAVEDSSVVDRHRRMKLVGSVALALHRLPKPTIAAVDGVAVGAGMNLALGCDLVIATERARFSEIFVRRGLGLDTGGSWLLPRIVGLQRAKEMSLTGRIVESAEALAIGLVLEIVAPDSLEARVTEVAEDLLRGAPLAQGFAKQMLNASFRSGFGDALSWEGQAQAVLMGSEDLEEGIAAFREKRDPEWKGR